MNNKTFGAILFATGAIIGSVATWFAVKTKYEKIAQEEIDSVKEEFDQLVKNRKKEMEIYHKIMDAHKNEESESEEDTSDDEVYDKDNDPEYEQTMIDYNNIARGYSVSGDDDDENCEEGDEMVDDEVPYINGPYVISPEEFGDRTDFSAQPLDYFADGVLADGWGVKMDIEETIGEESLNHFGEYDDVIYVRNERTEIDYEVTKDPRTYEERIGTNSYQNYEQ